MIQVTKIEDIEKAVEQLAPEELAKFRAWFEEFDARVFDEKIERRSRDFFRPRFLAPGPAAFTPLCKPIIHGRRGRLKVGNQE